MTRKYIILFCLIGLTAALIWCFRHSQIFVSVNVEGCVNQPSYAQLSPDYSNSVIPPNIAPLNFVIHEPGIEYFVKIHSHKGNTIEVYSRTGKIKIPIRKWKTLLNTNQGSKFYFDIYVRNNDKQWHHFKTVVNTIAKEKIDPFVAYRIINPLYNATKNTAIYQYDLENNTESLVLHGNTFYGGCVNCHSFLNYDPKKFLIGIRSSVYGRSTLSIEDTDVKKLGAKFGHTAWHPSGKIVAFSLYNVKQFFHQYRSEVRDVAELDSALSYYLVDKQIVKTTPELADRQQLETQPTWSPDGKYLYFPSAPVLWENRKQVPPDNYEKVKYDLKRISYDIETDTWGKLETFLSSEQTGKSILIPRFSPDGRFLLFTMCDYSCFALFQPNSDLYLMDMASGKYHEIKEANSDQAESWHAFSSNSRWIVFSSKRPEGIFTRLYFSYIDDSGRASKAFIMPQKDPAYYESCYDVYNVPEFITGPIKVKHKNIAPVVRSPKAVNIEIPLTAATPDPRADDEYYERE